MAPGTKPAGTRDGGLLDYLEGISGAGLHKKRSTSAEGARAAELLRVWQMTATERMALALALGRRGRSLGARRRHETGDP